MNPHIHISTPHYLLALFPHFSSIMSIVIYILQRGTEIRYFSYSWMLIRPLVLLTLLGFLGWVKRTPQNVSIFLYFAWYNCVALGAYSSFSIVGCPFQHFELRWHLQWVMIFQGSKNGLLPWGRLLIGAPCSMQMGWSMAGPSIQLCRCLQWRRCPWSVSRNWILVNCRVWRSMFSTWSTDFSVILVGIQIFCSSQEAGYIVKLGPGSCWERWIFLYNLAILCFPQFYVFLNLATLFSFFNEMTIMIFWF